MQIVCPKCGFVLRKTAGLHRAGEPHAAFQGHGYVIKCPHCGNEHRSGLDESDAALHPTAKQSGSHD